jgi:hypothetical protein
MAWLTMLRNVSSNSTITGVGVKPNFTDLTALSVPGVSAMVSARAVKPPSDSAPMTFKENTVRVVWRRRELLESDRYLRRGGTLLAGAKARMLIAVAHARDRT